MESKSTDTVMNFLWVRGGGVGHNLLKSKKTDTSVQFINLYIGPNIIIVEENHPSLWYFPSYEKAIENYIMSHVKS